VYEGSGPLDRERASRVADLVSSASRQGNAIAGFEASARLGAVLFLGPWVWNEREACWDRGACVDGGAALLDEWRAQDRGMVFGAFVAIRAAETMLREEIMADESCRKES
jgi:hypothetical protein